MKKNIFLQLKEKSEELGIEFWSLECVLGFPGYWGASDGTIWSTKRGTLIKRSLYKDGQKSKRYNKVDIWNSGKYYKIRVSRLLALSYYNIPLNDYSVVVHHKNLNHTDDRIDNLKVLTKEEHVKLHRKLRLEAKENKTA